MHSPNFWMNIKDLKVAARLAIAKNTFNLLKRYTAWQVIKGYSIKKLSPSVLLVQHNKRPTTRSLSRRPAIMHAHLGVVETCRQGYCYAAAAPRRSSGRPCGGGRLGRRLSVGRLWHGGLKVQS